jgi:hypothetical protein
MVPSKFVRLFTLSCMIGFMMVCGEEVVDEKSKTNNFNIVLVLADAWRYSAFGAAEDPDALAITPRLDGKRTISFIFCCCCCSLPSYVLRLVCLYSLSLSLSQNSSTHQRFERSRLISLDVMQLILFALLAEYLYSLVCTLQDTTVCPSIQDFFHPLQLDL